MSGADGNHRKEERVAIAINKPKDAHREYAKLQAEALDAQYLSDNEVMNLLRGVMLAAAQKKLKEGRYGCKFNSTMVVAKVDGKIIAGYKDHSNYVTCTRLTEKMMSFDQPRGVQHLTDAERERFRKMAGTEMGPLPEIDLKTKGKVTQMASATKDTAKEPKAKKTKTIDEVKLYFPNQTAVPMAEARKHGFEPKHDAPFAVKVKCDCGKVRYIHTQDAFQVSKCKDCKAASKKKNLEDLKEKAPAKKAEKKATGKKAA